MNQQLHEDDLYYDVLAPQHSGAIIILQEFLRMTTLPKIPGSFLLSKRSKCLLLSGALLKKSIAAMKQTKRKGKSKEGKLVRERRIT
jgi:hypothetical protein